MIPAQTWRPKRSPLAGRGLVYLADGSTFEGCVWISGGAVTIDGRLRVVSLVGGRRVATYRQRRCRTVALRLVREIVWSERPEWGERA